MHSLPSLQGAADAGPAPTAHSAVAAWRRWPLPALAAWLACWGGFLALRPFTGEAPAGVAALLLAGALALCQRGWARRTWVGAGFPLSAALWQGAAGWPAWVWLLPPALLLAVYPLRAWRDAPLFPTPPDALRPLAARLALPPGAAVLDAGCGAGDGLRALQAAWPQARVSGIEWSWPLALVSRWRCRSARVQRGDMWRPGAWQGQDLVYLFQRPESMARAWTKACAELPGGWLVSLEFAVPERDPDLRAALPGGREVLAWRVPAGAGTVPASATAARGRRRPQPGASRADKSR
jgi:hypothetical protein